MNKDTGLLILRIGLGSMFLYYGGPKLFGGPKVWEGLGMAMSSVGVNFLPVFWGFMASLSMALGGLFVILGILFRPSCAMIMVTMCVAAAMHLSKGQGFLIASHAIDDAIVFLSLLFIGPGKYVVNR